MHCVNKNQCELINGELMADASDLGLSPGDWPDFIAVLNNGNEGFLFRRGEIEGPGEGDKYRYIDQTHGFSLLVFND